MQANPFHSWQDLLETLSSAARVILSQLDDHMGPRWEEAFRAHLRRMAATGQLAPDVVAVGPWWNAAQDPVEIDAVVLAGRARKPILAGEAKWAKSVYSGSLAAELRRKIASLPGADPDLPLAMCAREAILGAEPALKVTAEQIFG